METNQNLNHILYKDSPFLPSITEEQILATNLDWLINRLPLYFAIASQITLSAIKQHIDQFKNYDWVAEHFDVSAQNLNDYFLGLVTPTNLIAGGYVLNHLSVKEAIKVYCPPTDNPEIIEHNRYKTFHLIKAHNILNSTSHLHPVKAVEPIFKLCKTEVYKEDSFYLTGVEACERLYAGFCEQIVAL